MIKQLSALSVFAIFSASAIAQEAQPVPGAGAPPIPEIPVIADSYDVINSHAVDLVSALHDYSGDVAELQPMEATEQGDIGAWQDTLVAGNNLEMAHTYSVDDFQATWDLIPEINLILLGQVSDSLCEATGNSLSENDFPTENDLITHINASDMEDGCVYFPVAPNININAYFHKF